MSDLMSKATTIFQNARTTIEGIPALSTVGGIPSAEPPSQFGQMGFTGATRIGTSLFENDTPLHAMINYVILAAALYLAFKCKKNGEINIVNMVLALCFSPCFLAYILIRKCQT